MSKRDLIKTEIEALHAQGLDLAIQFENKEDKLFTYDYQEWYSKALRTVATLAPERSAEFKGYYEADSKRKHLGYGSYYIQDYLRGVAPDKFRYPNFDTRQQVFQCFFNQLAILASLLSLADSTLANIQGELYSEIQDNELVAARQVAKMSLRAAGAIAGVVVEGHLQKIASIHRVKIAKKHPTIADLNDPLKAAAVIDTPTWRKISYLGDIRNLCSHKKDVEPTKEQVDELISGAEWLSKNVS